jgi:hypothetical protein
MQPQVVDGHQSPNEGMKQNPEGLHRPVDPQRELWLRQNQIELAMLLQQQPRNDDLSSIYAFRMERMRGQTCFGRRSHEQRQNYRKN